MSLASRSCSKEEEGGTIVKVPLKNTPLLFRLILLVLIPTSSFVLPVEKK
jgi:hypothetical protein